MQAQDALNEEPLDAGQAVGILADVNAHDIENRAPINYIGSFQLDELIDQNTPFDVNF